MLTKRLLSTRLETRTKESNICASIMVNKTKNFFKKKMHNESEGFRKESMVGNLL